MIRLSLEGTGAYLKALDKGVPNLPNQNIVTVQPNDDEDALWEVESDADNPVALGEPVANLSIIRLRHKRTQKRLYSHEKPKAEPLWVGYSRERHSRCRPALATKMTPGAYIFQRGTRFGFPGYRSRSLTLLPRNPRQPRDSPPDRA